jgi:hypothetical protein
LESAVEWAVFFLCSSAAFFAPRILANIDMMKRNEMSYLIGK